MQNTPLPSKPIPINSVAGNLLSPPSASGGVNWGGGCGYILVKRIRILNTTGSQVTCSMWLGDSGATAAGTEVVCAQLPIAPYGYEDCYDLMRIDAGQYLVGRASVGDALTVQFGGEIGMMALSQAAIDTELGT